jgi:hypothetical protein
MIKWLSILLLILYLPTLVVADQEEYDSGISDRIHINGEGAVAFFDTEEEGEFPNEEFRVDEAKLFFEAAIVQDIYVFIEIDLLRREDAAERLRLGELYVDFEDVGNKNRLFNVRFGRFDIPFGEEYLTRDAIDNPLISHSLSDIWGVDEGIQVYGVFQSLEYTLAIQNGGEPLANDFHSDKAIVGRLLVRPLPAFHLSVSAMRTGDLDVDDDRFSEVWFGNGFLLPLGSTLTTSVFSGEFFQGDAHANWQTGHVHAAAGILQYEDDDSAADNGRDADYFYIEAVQNLYQDADRKLHAAARFSRITADSGFPIVGFGNFERFLFDDDQLAEELWRLSLGVGYRIHKNILLKTEYSFENGRQVNGEDRDQENFFGIEAAMKF